MTSVLAVTRQITERCASEVQFNSRTECFTRQEDGANGGTRTVRLKGLMPCLRELFYPQYRFSGSARGDERAPVVRGARSSGSSRAGLSRGRHVDDTIQRCVERGVSNPSCRASRHVLAALTRLGLEPIMTQVPVHGGRLGLRVGTAADMVCLDRRGRIVIVEVKTGFANYYDRSTERMLGALSAVPSCPKYHHQMQVMLTALMFEGTTGLSVSDALVVRVLASGVQYVRVDRALMRRRTAIVAAMRIRFPSS
jgi:hypothetical protein